MRLTLSGCNKGELNKYPSEKQTSLPTTPTMTNDTQKDLTDEDLNFLNASAPAEMKLTSYIKNNIDISNND